MLAINREKENLVTQADLKDLFWLNLETGDPINRFRRAVNAPANAVAGCIDKITGYRIITINRVNYLAHRLVWLWHTAEWPADEIDHINGDRLDNRIENLRVVTCQENHKNKKLPSTNTSGVMGVCFHKQAQKWEAYIKVDGKKKYLGLFTDWFEAVCARKSAENKYGYHENHGRTQ